MSLSSMIIVFCYITRILLFSLYIMYMSAVPAFIRCFLLHICLHINAYIIIVILYKERIISRVILDAFVVFQVEMSGMVLEILIKK